jgi:uncharacterized protein YbjT (DUF2867 family)
MSKTIAVFGATGNQGGSVIQSLTKTGLYHLRAITRNSTSEKARELSKLHNVTIVEADLNDNESVDNALKNCYGVFLVTDFSAHFKRNQEANQGINVIDKAIKNKVSHVVFSGLENVYSQIDKPCFHFDEKSTVDEHGLKLSESINYTSIRMPMFYQELTGKILNKAACNQYVFNLPMNKDKMLYCMNVNDIGDCVTAIFAFPDKFKSKIVPVAGDYIKVEEIVALMNDKLKPLKVFFPGGALNRFLFRFMKFEGALDIQAMFEYFSTGLMNRDLALTKTLNPNVATLAEWLTRNRDKIVEKKHNSTMF